MFAILNRPASTSLPNQAFWSKFKPKGKEPEDKQGPMAVARQRLMTLAYGEFETLLKVWSFQPFLQRQLISNDLLLAAKYLQCESFGRLSTQPLIHP
jgi:hypothetical protein